MLDRPITIAAARILHPDILPHILKYTDDATLLSLLRVNRLFFEVAGRQLYNVVLYDEAELIVQDLLPGGSVWKDRLLQHVRHVAIGYDVVMYGYGMGPHDAVHGDEAQLQEEEKGSGESGGAEIPCEAEEGDVSRHEGAAMVDGTCDDFARYQSGELARPHDDSATSATPPASGIVKPVEQSEAISGTSARGAGDVLKADDEFYDAEDTPPQRPTIPMATSSLPILPGLFALRFPIASELTFCQTEDQCVYCDFYLRLRPKVWVIECAHQLFHPPSDVGEIPDTLETIIMGFNVSKGNYVYNTYRSDTISLFSVLAPAVQIVIFFSGIEAMELAPSTYINKYEMLLIDLVQLCTIVPNAITIAGSTQDRTYWGRPDIPVDPGPWDVEPVLRSKIREKMEHAGEAEQAIRQRLASVKCVEAWQLEKEDWAPVMGDEDSSEWFKH